MIPSVDKRDFFGRPMDPRDEQAGAWTEAFDSGKFVRKSSEFRDHIVKDGTFDVETCLLYTSPSPRDLSTSRMPSSA